MSLSVLHIDASVRSTQSASRTLSQAVVDHLSPDTLVRRDLIDPLPLIDEAWTVANFTPVADRTDEQSETLRLSDTLIAELRAADVIVIGAPVYNFSIPAGLKAWLDLVARAGETFSYTSEGPKGLLEGKRVIVAYASGGTKLGSEIDFASGYLRHVLGFIGITDVEFVAADSVARDAQASLDAANAAVLKLAS
jgi:FMN-dependent NADH-azoreductase